MTVCHLNEKNRRKIEKIIGKPVIMAFVRGGWGHYVYAYVTGEPGVYYKVDRKTKTFETKKLPRVGETWIYLGAMPEEFRPKKTVP